MASRRAREVELFRLVPLPDKSSDGSETSALLTRTDVPRSRVGSRVLATSADPRARLHWVQVAMHDVSDPSLHSSG